MNFWRRRKYESWLVPYADGTLDERRRMELEVALSQDPTLAANAKIQQRIAGRLRGAAWAEDTPPESETSRLWPQIQTRISPKRHSFAPLIWAGGACAAACLGWAAIWGPLGQPAQPLSNSMTPAIMATGTADQLPTSLPPPKHHGKVYKPRMSVKIAHYPGESIAPLASPAAPVESQEMASAERNAQSMPSPESTAPMPMPVADAGNAARIRTAVGIHDDAPADMSSRKTFNPQDQNSSGAGVVSPELKGNLLASDSGTVVPPADGSADAVKQKSMATPVQKLPGRRHRRSHRHGVAPASSKPAPTATQKTSPVDNSAPMPIDDTPKPVHILAKPVD